MKRIWKIKESTGQISNLLKDLLQNLKNNDYKASGVENKQKINLCLKH